MRVSFTRGEGRRHQITAVGEDGRVGFYAMADYGAALPHDLAHVVVESMFDLPYGFWGLVAAGARFDTLNRAASGAEPVRRTDPIVEAHLDELLEAEALVNLFHEQQIAGREDDATYMDKANSLSEARGRTLPSTVTVEQVGRARRGLAALNARWQATPPGETLHLEFPQPDDAG